MDTSLIYLRALEPEDYKTTHQWRIEEGITNVLGGTKRFISLETERNWVQRAIELHEQAKALRFVICESESNKVLGMFSATDIDFINSTCELHQIIDSPSRGKGIYQKASKLVLDYMFFELNINRVTLNILESNHSSCRAAE